MKYSIFTIANGNSTALVWDISKKNRLQSSKTLLRSVEQVGFINFKVQSLEMMGGEMCINASLAAAKIFGGKGSLKINGQKIMYDSRGKKCSITIPFTIAVVETDTILMDDIGYIFVRKQLPRKTLSRLARKYNLPAFGSVILNGNEIKSRVYVREVNSCVDETACGSASVAAYVVTRRKKIKQPSGGTIFVDKVNGKYQITAKVEEVKM